MNKRKLLKMITFFFVLFILSGIGSIFDFYYGIYPLMFKKPFDTYEILRLGQVTVKMPGVPFFLAVVTVIIFVLLFKKLYGRIVAEIRKEN